MYLKELFLFILYLILLSYIYIFLEVYRYELYLDIDIVDSVYRIDVITIYLLNLLHITILFFMGYNREKLFRT